MEAFIKSVDEPQLERCLEAVKNQTVPFSKIVHINGIVPESVAHNYGINKITDEWFALINGDMILYLDAVEKGIEKINMDKDGKVYAHTFKLYDPFLQSNYGGIGFFRTEIYKSNPIRDRLNNDRNLGKKLGEQGWIVKRHGRVIGTHFDSPDEYQIFRRFYVIGLKYVNTSALKIFNTIMELLEKTGDSLYLVAMEAMKFSKGKKGTYPGSHNIDFERKMFEEFKRNENLNYHSNS